MKKVLTGQRNQCPSCNLYFNSNLAFDLHRTGDHGVDRRCRSEKEMLVKGMALNASGFWVSELMPDSVIKQKEEV
jgi:hypothetical protein